MSFKPLIFWLVYSFDMQLEPINRASQALTKSILAIEPSFTDQAGSVRPCSLLMKDGRTIECAFCNQNARYSDRGDWIHPEIVADVFPSKYRMPVELARVLYDAGETGNGYMIFELEFPEQKPVACATGALYLDFPRLPPEYDIRSAVGVHPHVSREKLVTGYRCHTHEHVICDYVPFDY